MLDLLLSETASTSLQEMTGGFNYYQDANNRQGA
jgi:hypothetical protein